MRRSCRLAQTLLVLVGMLLSACGAPAQADVARSERPRQAEPQVAAEELRALVAGNNRFAVDLYHGLAGQGGNLLFSPHSIAQALAMAYAGARGDTAAQMRMARRPRPRQRRLSRPAPRRRRI